MAKKTPKRKLVLEVRHFERTKWVRVLLIDVDGAARSCLLSGALMPRTAEELAGRLGVEIESDSAPYAMTKSERKTLQAKNRTGLGVF